ncbi:MAG: transketolase, partial [Planctomycetes bacterium]|nr:transketolase [Planctomycetota bacterium]
DRIVTTSPDVAVSTNLGGWINRRGVFSRQVLDDIRLQSGGQSMLNWELSPSGQHVELGIAENNLFLMLSALGLSHELFGERLIPIGTIYDPFIGRGLDALNYACYQDARFILVATPSGISLAAEGGLHQSLATPLIGMAQDGLAAFEPAFVDELAVILRWAFDYIQRDGSGEATSAWLRDALGGSVYLRLSSRPLKQPSRELSAGQEQAIVDGGYWLKEPARGASLAIVYSGVVAQEAQEAHEQLAAESPGAGLLAVTSADRLNAGWQASHRVGEGRVDGSWIETLLEPLADDAALVTVIDGHPATLSWLGGVHGHRVESLGVEHFGQSGNLPDLYRHYGLDAEAILAACHRQIR